MHTDICAYIGVYLNTVERVYMKVYDIYIWVYLSMCVDSCLYVGHNVHALLGSSRRDAETDWWPLTLHWH